MNQIDGLLILVALPLCLLLNGYWAAALLAHCNALERLAAALLFGLGLLIAAVAAVNFFGPLAGIWAYLCLAPIVLTLALPRSASGLIRDLVDLWRSRSRWVVLGLAGYFVLLLWPVLIAPLSLFYDGTSNHDSFFWIAAAEHLKRNSYMDFPVASATQPLFNPSKAITGWSPDWGRMGAEGLLALASSVIGVSPLKLYLYATASLYLAWLSGAYLALKTFVTEKPGILTCTVLVALQPLFAFFYGNSNLPNLLGALTGGACVIAVERALRARATGERDSDGYLILVALSFHGLLCCYPEMVPFVLLPAGLLWLRRWVVCGFKAGWWPCVLVAGAILLGAALNVATTVRAVHGFLTSFTAARANESWANLFNPLALAEYFPGLVTLSIPGAKELGWWFGWPLSVVILSAMFLMLRRGRDWFGILAVFSGSLALITYTVATDFAYGWQKTVQFSGVFFAMAFPAAATEVLQGTLAGATRLNRRLGLVSLWGLLAFLGFATLSNFREIYKWSDRKVISADWFALRDLARGPLLKAPVLVETATFRMAFFHGMWSAYFLNDANLYFGARGEEAGGYLRGDIVREGVQPIPTPRAILVGRPWADTLDANSPRFLTGREYVLLQKSNRVGRFEGIYPQNGTPDNASGHILLEITPHTNALLSFTLKPRLRTGAATGDWSVRRDAPGVEPYTATVGSAAPWSFRIPLVAGQLNRVEVTFGGTIGADDKLPFAFNSLRMEDAP